MLRVFPGVLGAVLSSGDGVEKDLKKQDETWQNSEVRAGGNGNPFHHEYLALLFEGATVRCCPFLHPTPSPFRLQQSHTKPSA